MSFKLQSKELSFHSISNQMTSLETIVKVFYLSGNTKLVVCLQTEQRPRQMGDEKSCFYVKEGLNRTVFCLFFF